MLTVRTELLPGVSLNYVHATKFKTGLLSVQLVTPLAEETASAAALLPAVLRRGTTQYPDMRALSCALDRLYGASVAYTLRKYGENQCLGFVASFIDDAYALPGERLLEPIAELLGALLLDPVTKNGRFLAPYVEGEKANLTDAIRSIVDDKRSYADMRLLQEMCRGERYGVSRYGTEERVGKLNNQTLYRYYRDLLAHAPIELFYCGSAARERVEDAMLRALAPLPREAIAPMARTEVRGAPAETRFVRETMDVTQGKLAMGFRASSRDLPAMLLANIIFGGYSNSKLFLTVREKLSLCYYVSSVYHRAKGLVTVSSGIESGDCERARSEILAQLDAVRGGEIEPWELDGARALLVSSLRQQEDSPGRMEDFAVGHAATDFWEDADSLIAGLAGVTRERIAEAAQSVEPDTVYFLSGEEAESE